MCPGGACERLLMQSAEAAIDSRIVKAEESLSSSPITLSLEVNIHHFAIPKALRGAGFPGRALSKDNATCL